VVQVSRKVVSIDDAKVARLARELALDLVNGSIVRSTAKLDDIGLWRKAARKAGRDHGWRIATGVSDDGSKVWVVREDREVTAEEDALAGRLVSDLIQRSRGASGDPTRPPTS